MCVNENTVLARLVLISNDSALPVPSTFCCESRLQDDALGLRVADAELDAAGGRSLTLTLTSTWSAVPGTAGVSTFTSSK